MKPESILFWTAVVGDLVLFFYGVVFSFRAVKLFRENLAKSMWNASAACALLGLAMLLPWSLVVGDQHVGKNALMICLIVAPFVAAWKPLHKRFRTWAILVSYFFVLTGWMGVLSPNSPDDWMAMPLGLASSAVFLLFNRRKPVEQRKPTVAWMVIHGLWDQLAKEGVPPDEIERLKRLTPEERARLMAEIMKPIGLGLGPHNQDEDEDVPWWRNPIYSGLHGNIYNTDHL
ncbi:hypothetical protein [Pelomicrobium methylotrophicum]|uniref:Uncharacterized protein n=1 Tax=Pelomicrobium methylotrophicum TaxID=2602750 RepID=A0A5C7EIJ2_9PROT|nr:hypothetical protein [Pelomicrobium methylotrophicum]TXF11210.1 hypothetical protein FR698_11915 [Pelomicrobium methylotrophicum]